MKHTLYRWRFWGLAGLTAVCLIGLWRLERLGITLEDWASLLPLAAWVERLDQLGPWREAGFVAAHIVATVLGVPGTLLVVAGGAMFGVAWGTLWSVLGATLGAIAAFALARYCLRRWCQRRFQHSPSLSQINAMLNGEAFWCVLALRLAPISPFNVLNFLLGLTPVSSRAYTLGTALGIIPGTALYTWVGAAGGQALSQRTWMPLAFALSGLAALSLTPLLLRRRQPSILEQGREGSSGAAAQRHQD
jgi:uncharacterized membrane protein YdjX (TVP38/TMEM64 family)